MEASVQLVLRHPQFVQLATTVLLAQVTLSHAQLEHSKTTVDPTLLRIAHSALLGGTVMPKVFPFPEPSVTQVMCALVEHTQEHQMMVSPASHVQKGHSVSQAPLSLILAHLGHTVRAPGEQVIRIVSLVIRDTIVQGSN